MAHQLGNYSKNPADPSYYGGIYVKLDQESFIPGDTLTGKVYLDLVNAYPGDMICLAVKGHELAKWIDRIHKQRPRPDGTMESYTEEVPREGTIDIIKQDLTLYDWNKGAIVPKGQYTFPFQFKIPEGAPGSFFFKSGTTLAEIKYSVEGYLKPEKESVPRLRHKLQITVRENPTVVCQQKEVSITKNLTTWCCCNQGTVSMRTAFEKNAYVPGEEARIITEVDNSKCSLGIPDVTFSLNQNISLSAGGHGRGFNFNIRSVNLGRIEAGASCLGPNRKEASIMLPPGQEGKAKDFKEGMDDIPLDIKSVMTPSTHGKLVKSDFSLTVYCQTEGCLCCDTAPSTSLPILVYAKAQPKQPELVPPPNWQPQQMPPANLTITIINTPGGGTTIQISQGPPQPQPGMISGEMPMNQAPQQPQPYPPQQQGQFPAGPPQQQYPPQQQQYPPQQYPPQQYPPQQYPPQQPGYGQPQPIQPQPVQVGHNQYQQYPPQGQY